MKKNATHGPARTLALALASAAILLGILSLPWRGARPAAPPAVVRAASGRGPLQAGAAVRRIELGPSPVVGGFPRLRWAAEGVRDETTARALVLSVPGCTVALASAEILLVPGALAEAVRQRLQGLGLDEVVVGATHTHAGPGGYWDSLPGQLAGTGPYDPAALARVADALAGAVRDALAARAPATLAVARGRAEALVRNRTGAAEDGRLLSLRVARPGGAPVAELVVYAAHPTLLGGDNRLLSGDWPGRLLAAGGHGTRLFFQGALGDQSPRPPAAAGDVEEAFAAALDGVLAGLPAGPADAAPALAVATATVTLPPLAPGAVPAPLRPALATLLGGSMPAEARVTALRAGGALLLFTPAEPTEEVGRALRAAAGPDAEVVSLAGDYAGYVDTAARIQAGAGESQRAYYGPQLAARLEAAVVAAAREADGGAAAGR